MVGKYIYAIKPYESTIREIYENNGFVTWEIPCARNKIVENDIIYIYICKGSDSVTNKSDLICFNECIVYEARVLEILAVNNRNCKKLLRLHIKNIAPFAIEKLTKNDFSREEKRFSVDKNGVKQRIPFHPPQSIPIDLSSRGDLKKYIEKVLGEQNIIPAVPESFEEKMLCEFLTVKSLFSDIIKGSDGKKARCNKLNGNISSNIFIKYIQEVIDKYGLPYKVSEPNVYIRGCKTEWDALILKKDAYNIMGCNLYNVHDVVSVLEFKTSGIFYKVSDPLKAGAPLKNFFDSFADINSRKDVFISAGYITMYEYEPENGEHYFLETVVALSNLRDSLKLKHKKECICEAFCLENTSDHTLYKNKNNWVEFVLSLLP